MSVEMLFCVVLCSQTTASQLLKIWGNQAQNWIGKSEEMVRCKRDLQYKKYYDALRKHWAVSYAAVSSWRWGEGSFIPRANWKLPQYFQGKIIPCVALTKVHERQASDMLPSLSAVSDHICPRHTPVASGGAVSDTLSVFSQLLSVSY